MEGHENAYEAFIEYTTWCFANPHASDNDRLMAQWRIASAAGLTPVEKAYLDAHVYADNKAVKDPRNAQGVVELDLDDEGTPILGRDANLFRVDV